MGLLVAVHAQMPHARRRDQVEHAVDHAKPGTEDGHHRELLARHPLAARRADGGFDVHVGQRQIARCLVALEQGKLTHELAELLARGRFIAQDGKLVLHHRVIDEGDATVVHGSFFRPKFASIKKRARGKPRALHRLMRFYQHCAAA